MDAAEGSEDPTPRGKNVEEGAGANPQNQEQHAVEPTLNDEELEEIHEEWTP